LMSVLMFNGRVQAQHVLFASANLFLGPEAVRQGFTFSGGCSAVLIGTDISLPGGATHNPPTAMGPFWSQLVPGGPPLAFIQDANIPWIRGHLVNGDWSGPGHDWRNLVPLTPIANHNHATVENFMRAFCHASLYFDEHTPGYKPEWYGVIYQVQASVDPWAAVPANADLYSYAPAFIKVSWRAVSIPKPNIPANLVQAYLDGLVGFAAVNPLPFVPPLRPAAIAAPCVPIGNAAGFPVYPGPLAFPAAQPNGFDGEIEVHQS
jgi:hypothetical protein